MQKQPTIRDVATAAGVSVAVVSRVLNPGSGPVAAATRGRVHEVMETLGYHPRTAARELKHGPPTTLGLLLADVSNPFFARLADQVVQEAHSRGIQVLLMTTQEDDQLESERLSTLIERRVSGIIATPTGNNLEIWKKLQDMGTDVVFVDRSIPALPEVDVVTINNTESARSATALLAAMGIAASRSSRALRHRQPGGIGSRATAKLWWRPIWNRMTFSSVPPPSVGLPAGMP